MKKDKPDDYLTYLLRLWPINGNEKTVWRISLESTHTRQRRGFNRLEDLVTFLRQKMVEPSDIDQME